MTAPTIMKGKAGPADIDTGIDLPDRALLVDGLASVLGDCYVLQFKTRVAGWNVVGPMLLGVQELMTWHGEDLSSAVDTLARRIRALGYPAPERLTALVERSELDEEAGIVRGNAQEMIDQLARDYQAVARSIRTVAGWAEQTKDQVTFNLLAVLLEKQEEAIWKLKALLD